MAEIISKRAETVVDWEDFVNFYILKCSKDAYSKEDNPNGYINLGTSVNKLCTDFVYPKLSDVWTWEESMLQYQTVYGIVRLRKALAALITEFFIPAEKINPDNVR
ncbi:probable inactive 1-aminocyclopropane-1-carboxylate synthase-like protein 2 [Uloborus diversus]|uniref:probable inactive 1-aminocyclopropane-1-carboxylate synthase-like protein 2 n=1 Tax=Uloborus diversus TaxID=327109 RepID=UPI0024096907|nr:probable inactive 1-aminocyclopropane-1-carboxylate synthase-like protein 2 [Uloborus diversus]